MESKFSFFTKTVPILAHTFNMGENKSLYYMNEILLEKFTVILYM